MVDPFVEAHLTFILEVLSLIIGLLTLHILTPAWKAFLYRLTKKKEAEAKVLDVTLNELVKDKEEDRITTRDYVESLSKRVGTLERQNAEAQVIKDKLETQIASLVTEKKINVAQTKVAIEKWQSESERWEAEAALWKQKSEQLEERLCIAEATLKKIEKRFPKWWTFVMNEVKEEDIARLDNLFDDFIEDLEKKGRAYNE